MSPAFIVIVVATVVVFVEAAPSSGGAVSVVIDDGVVVVLLSSLGGTARTGDVVLVSVVVDARASLASAPVEEEAAGFLAARAMGKKQGGCLGEEK
jgi:hypothetical protein